MTRAHTQAIIDQLASDPFLTGNVYEGIVITATPTDRPQAYCSVFTNTGITVADRLAGLQTRSTIRYVIHSVGRRPDQAQLIADHVVALLTNFAPAVDGWQCNRIRHEASQTTQIDREVPGYPVYYAVDEFDLVTQPSTS